MKKNNHDVEWIDISDKLIKEWKIANEKKEETESNIIEFPRPDGSFPEGSGEGA